MDMSVLYVPTPGHNMLYMSTLHDNLCEHYGYLKVSVILLNSIKSPTNIDSFCVC